jgi:hypothetical protein
MPEQEAITVAIIDHDKDFFQKSLALLQKEKDIDVCVKYLRVDYQKDDASAEAAANDVCKCQPRVLIHSQMIIRDAAARNLKHIL